MGREVGIIVANKVEDGFERVERLLIGKRSVLSRVTDQCFAQLGQRLPENSDLYSEKTLTMERVF